MAAADASDATAVDVDASDKLVPANQPPIDCNAGSAVDEAPFAALMADEVVVAAASPAVPGGKVSRTPAVDDPGVTSTATVAVGYCASSAACTMATSAGVSGLAKVI